MRYGTIFLLILSVQTLLPGQQGLTPLEHRLYTLPDIIFEKIPAPEGYQVAFELKVRQPVDHEDPEKGYFYQRAFLSHRNVEQPMVLITEGYDREQNYPFELSELLQANQLIVEHRYFGASVPSRAGLKHLNLKNATADLHRIRTLIGQIYQSDWVSTGVSKGGQTTIYYRYFYPDDVQVSVPYVAPMSRAYEDERLYNYLDTVGGAACQKELYDFQLRLLNEREEVLKRLRWYARGANQRFTFMNLEAAFEYAVLELPFSFFQYGNDCNSIPSSQVSIDDALSFFMNTVGLSLYTDQEIYHYGPHYWQAASEMGYYGFRTEKFDDLLKALPDEPHAAFIPFVEKPRYDGALAAAATNWLEKEGDRFIYIYGEDDTWTAAGVPPSRKVDAVWFVLKDKHHGTARIGAMTPEELSVLIQKLQTWLK